MTKLQLPTGDAITLSDDADAEAALDAITGYAEEEAERVAPDTDELEAKLSRKEEKISELSAAKELLVDEVCRRKQLAEEEFDASDDREKVAALSVEELENQLDGLNPAPDAENITTSDEPTGEGVYDFAATE
jgi:TolA-binding protein